MLIFIIWSLYLIAQELEQPFGTDEDDLSLMDIQHSILATSIAWANVLTKNSPPKLVTKRADQNLDWQKGSTSVMTKLCETQSLP